MIRIQGLHKHFDHVPVLRDVSLEVARGEVVTLIGPSGSGKSTLLRCINGLVRPDAGSVTVNGTTVGPATVRELRQRISMVFQQFHLFPHRTALENVMEGPRFVQGTSRAEAERLARGLLDRVGLGDKMQSYPRQLSGGQQQRVAIARALVNRPRLILADEPTGNLDSHTSEEIMALFEELNREGITIVLVTHEPDIAQHAKRQVRFLDGRIVHDAPTHHDLPAGETQPC